MKAAAGSYDSFVVRIWRQDRQFVQGQVTHVTSRRSIYFRDVGRLLAFLVTPSPAVSPAAAPVALRANAPSRQEPGGTDQPGHRGSAPTDAEDAEA